MATAAKRRAEQSVLPDDETLAAMAKAIGHPARVAILRLLAHRDTCATGDVVAELPLAQSTVSEHLRILRDTFTNRRRIRLRIARFAPARRLLRARCDPCRIRLDPKRRERDTAALRLGEGFACRRQCAGRRLDP